MPMKPKRLCCHGGCGEITDQRYCEKHREKEKEKRKLYDANRPSWYKWYDTARWKMLRAKFMMVFPLCEECKAEGLLTPSVILDHKVPHKGDPGLFWDTDNLQTMCKRHHDSKTSREDSWNNKKTPTL